MQRSSRSRMTAPCTPGHLGAQGGGGHFRVTVVSARFEGFSRVAAQRLVYQALGELMATDIHALEMRTFTPEQWARIELQRS